MKRPSWTDTLLPAPSAGPKLAVAKNCTGSIVLTSFVETGEFSSPP
jgi:hypothetical protein